MRRLRDLSRRAGPPVPQQAAGGRPVVRAVVAVILVGTVALLGVAGASPTVQGAGNGVPLPVPAGSVWEVAAGYNTATHYGDDPHALDLVRVDALTAGTPVLAPVAGTISYVSSDCLTIQDGNRKNHLLCHIWPFDWVTRGLEVAVGQTLATIASGGYAGNNGLPHIHYAIHEAIDGGYLGVTVPFTGLYALEGEDFLSSGEYNQHAGRQIVSSNPGVPTQSASPPGGASASSGGAAAPSPALQPPLRGDADYLYPGWNLVGWQHATPIAEAASGVAAQISSVYGYDPTRGAFTRYAPLLPPGGNTLSLLPPGSGTWVYVTDPAGVLWRRSREATGQALQLAAGFNLVSWTGDLTDVATVAADLGSVLVGIYGYDAVRQQYVAYRPGGPSILNELTALAPGDAAWVEVTGPATWTPPPPAPPPAATPAATPAPETASPAISAPAASAEDGVRVIGPGCLNLRPAPTTIDAPPLDCLAVGTVVVPTGATSRDSSGREWLAVQVAGTTGWVASEFVMEFSGSGADVAEVTYYHPSLEGQGMYCGGVYAASDPTIAASTVWPCGTRLRLWRGDRFVDVTVQDTGYLALNHVDVSEAAFLRLGALAEGRLLVRLEVLP